MPRWVRFNCPTCRKVHRTTAANAGSRLPCSDCGTEMRVPRAGRRPGERQTIGNRLVSGLVYGGAGALVGLALGAPFAFGGSLADAGRALGIAAGIGFVLCALGGEPVVNFVGRCLNEEMEGVDVD